jgi:hypothetical protein
MSVRLVRVMNLSIASGCAGALKGGGQGVARGLERR